MEITLLLALILIVGFIAAKAGQAIRLPSVTGFIAAGVLLGPSGQV
jgi:Kef-type K+ transport system membrane component KefB